MIRHHPKPGALAKKFITEESDNLSVWYLFLKAEVRKSSEENLEH